MNKKRGIIILSILVSITIIGCAILKLVSNKYSKETWTIYMYLCGTDLESSYGYASDNIEEILGVRLNKNIRYIIQTGGTRNWDNDNIDPNKTQRFIVENNKLKLLDELELQNMGKESTLTDFISFGLKNYKSDKYGFIFWNHGGGSVSGVTFDELYDDDSLELEEISSSLRNINENNNIKFEFVGFDCCLMSSLETAVAFEPYANYMIASQEFEPGCGWAYSTWLDYLSDNTDANGENLGRVICDSYFNKCKDFGSEEMVTLSVTNLNKVQPLVESLDKISMELYNSIEDKNMLTTISKGILRSEKYGGNSKEEGYSNYIDLGDLMLNIKYDFNAETEEVLSALQEVIVYQKNGKVRDKANGLSIYYPINSNIEELVRYQNISVSENYKSFIQESFVHSKENYDGIDLVKISEGSYINDDAYYEMIIDPDTIQYANTISFSLFYKLEDKKNTRLFLGSDTDLDVNYDSGKIIDNFRGVWPAIEGQLINMSILEETDDYIYYTVPILLNGNKTNLRIAWEWEEDYSGTYKIIGVWDGVDNITGMSSRNVEKLKNGDKLSLINIYYNENTREYYEEIGDEIIINNTSIEEIDLNPGIYYYNFNIIDVFGNENKTDSTEFEISDDGTIYVERP